MILAVAALLIPCQATLASNWRSGGALATPVATADASSDTKASVPVKTGQITPPTDSVAPIKSTSSSPLKAATPLSAADTSNGASLNIYLPPPPAFRPQTETLRRPSRSFFILMATEHSAAGFDAWSTRQAVSQGRFEADPLMRPFAHSGAIYGAIQVLPLGLDFVAHRMQRSSGWTRHVWWLPQSLATATYLFSGSYNFAHTR
ncbi:MAG TPA: hypothetical protein VGT03_07575 [Candidatus Acidoferrales bacterium]|nr:hypothetical protein [Candidatus Acidoferrales bacterium]